MRGKEFSEIDLNPLIASARENIERLRAKVPDNKILLAYSGGKDSIVIAHIARAMGLRTAVCDESFVFRKDAEDYRKIALALDIDATFVEGLSLDWLKANPEYIFAPMALQFRLYRMRQQRTVERHAKNGKYEGVIFGRRHQENSVKSELYQLKDGRWQCHPIANWSTANVWQYIRDTGLPYPRIYDARIGAYEGATPWNAMNLKKLEEDGVHPFDLIAEYEIETLREIAEWHAPARAYIAEKGL